MENDVIGFACGRCLVVREAHHTPDFCGACGARFDRGAPLAMVHVEIETLDLGIDIAPNVQLLGVWTTSGQLAIVDRIEQMLDRDTDATRVADGRDT